MKVNEKGIALIKKFESLHDNDLSMAGLQPKLCPAGIWTVGWGRAIIHNGKFLKGTQNQKIAYSLYPNLTKEEADNMLKEDLEIFSQQVRKLITVKLNSNQFSALVSFAYNLGAGNLASSTLLKKVNKNPEDVSIRLEFLKWDKANGKQLRGLTLRRNEESNLYFTK